MRPTRTDLVDSGVPWLGRVPANWKTKPLWSMFERIKDIDHPKEVMLSVFREHGVVAKDSRDNINRTAENRSIYQLVHPGWLVANRMKAWQGSVGISALRGIVSGHYICFAPRHNEDHRYLNWLLRSTAYTNGYALLSRGVRIGQAEIDNDELRLMPILLPPVEEQRAIADHLDRETAQIDTLISKQEQLIATLRERRRSLVTRAVTLGIDPSAELRDSGDPTLGLVPAGWTVKAARHWFSSLDGRRIPLSSEERTDRQGPYEYYGASGVIDHVDGYIFDEELVLVSEDGANLLLRSTPISFAATGRYWVNNHAHVLRPRVGQAQYWAHRLEAIDVAPLVSGSAQPKLTAGALMGIRIAAPSSDSEQREIVAYVNEQTAKIDSLMTKAERFIELSKERRAALITAAVTGQIDVRASV